MRHYSLQDRMLSSLEQGISILCNKPLAQRDNPALPYAEAKLSPKQIRHQIGLMRVNHAGEMAAQGLYQGQALTAKQAHTELHMKQAAQEEIDHLAWCQDRLYELEGRTSYLDPLWYFGSLIIGAAAGIAGDRWSLGFIAETEHQVAAHLANHLAQCASEDRKTQSILTQMKVDEEKHATQAIANGAAVLPKPIQWLMKFTSKIMVTTAYYL